MQLARHTIASHTPRPTFVHGHLTYLSPSVEASSHPLAGSGSTGSKASTSIKGKGKAPLETQPRSTAPKDPAHNAPTAVLLACATPKGFTVMQLSPPRVVAQREFPASRGTLSQVAAIDGSSLLLLVGGGRVPLFAPNKVILWDEAAEVEVEDAPPRAPSPRVDLGSDRSRPRRGTPDFFGSPKASTIFSAGSTFDRDGEDHEAEAHRTSGLASSRSASPASLDDDAQMSGARSTSPAPMSPILGSQPPDVVEAERSASPEPMSDLPSFSGMYGSTSSVSSSTAEAPKQDIHASVYSISASSAGLEDPFAAPLKPQEAPRPMTASIRYAERGVEDLAQGPAKPEGWASASAAPQTGPPRGILSATSSPKASILREKPQLSDSAASQPQPQQQRQRRRQARPGRVVAQLEFDEAVQGIRVRSFQLPKTGSAEKIPAAGFGRSSPPAHVAIIVVILRTKAIVFELGPTVGSGSGEDGKGWGIKQRLSLDIHSAKKGLADLCLLPDRSSALLALTGRQAGHVQLVRLPLLSSKSSTTGAASIIAAHSSSLASITLSADGTMLATASGKGTLIRVWRTLRSGAPSTSGGGSTTPRPSSKKLMVGAALWMELRRGTDPAAILSVAFSPDNRALAAASDKGTVHLWHLVDAEDGKGSTKADGRSSPHTSSTSQHQRTPSTGIAARYLPSALGNLASSLPASMLPQYLSSNWSAAQFRIPLRTFAAFDRGVPNQRARPRGGGRVASSAQPRLPIGLSVPGSLASGPSSTRPGSGDFIEDPSPFTTAGASKSTDGAWATMKGRIDDARRGEAGVDERIVLGWIRGPKVLESGPEGRKGKARAKAKAQGRSGEEAEEGEVEEEGEKEFQLLAITTSGGCYRIRLDPPPSTSSGSHPESGASSAWQRPSATGKTVLDMYTGADASEGVTEREDGAGSRVGGGGAAGERAEEEEKKRRAAKRAQTQTGASQGCSLLEFVRFADADGWAD